MIWVMKHPRAHPDMLGYIPEFLSDDDPRPARIQLDSNYQHGGGWRPTRAFKMRKDGNLDGDQEDPTTLLIAESVLHANSERPELIRFYEHSLVAIIQQDGSYEISRMD